MKNRTIRRVSMVAALLGGTLVLFQNCSGFVQFGSIDDQLVAKAVSDDADVFNFGGSEDVSEEDAPYMDPVDPVNPVDPNQGDSANNDDSNSDDGDDAGEPDNHANNGRPNNNNDENGAPGNSAGNQPEPNHRLIYQCVVNGPGQSLRIHLESAFNSKTSQINVVCMSRRACEEVISQVFDVKEAKESSGPCLHNKHNIQLSDAEIEARVAGLLAN